MTRSRRSSSSLLPHRPKTSSALDDRVSSTQHPDMKRTASQTFSPLHNALPDSLRDAEQLGAVQESASMSGYAPSTHTQASSISRVSQTFGSFKQICRRLSTSSRRPSISGFADLNNADNARTNISSSSRLKLRLQVTDREDSSTNTPTLNPPTLPSSNSEFPHHAAHGSKFPHLFHRIGSLRGHRRPATSGPSGDFARYNPAPAPIPSQYPAAPCPGQAARAAAAAANIERLNKRQEEAQFHYDLLAHGRDPDSLEEVLKDSESGVGMSCTTPVEEEDEDQEMKFGMSRSRSPSLSSRFRALKVTGIPSDPIQALPAEITTVILSNLDAHSLVRAECVSKAWQEAASCPHVWKKVFLRRFEPEVHVSPTPITMGGPGVGKFKNGKPLPGQDWKKMYKVRMTINRRWRGCSPSAIYLNGHTDSVYCCQFDE